MPYKTSVGTRHGVGRTFIDFALLLVIGMRTALAHFRTGAGDEEAPTTRAAPPA
jgi:hypothetical protein